jgi:ferredoxin-thioredoxin reductase catalytic subunit
MVHLVPVSLKEKKAKGRNEAREEGRVRKGKREERRKRINGNCRSRHTDLAKYVPCVCKLKR